jgi:hypothetical protein
LMGMAPSVFPFSASWRLLRGEPLELVARETNVSIARLTRSENGGTNRSR